MGSSHRALEEAARKAADPVLLQPYVNERILPLQTPAVEDTPMGRAAIAGEAAAERLTEVADFAAKLLDHVAGLNKTVMTEVLPTWHRTVSAQSTEARDATVSAKQSLISAKQSLFWAKWALWASVGVSIVLTSLQLWVAKEYKVENDAQQTRTEHLLADQLEASRTTNKLLAEELAATRATLQSMANRETRTSPTTPSDSTSTRLGSPTLKPK